jgi:hypothetical protein
MRARHRTQTAKRLVTIEVPQPLFDRFEALRDERYSGLPRQSLIKAAMALALLEPEKFGDQVGRV